MLDPIYTLPHATQQHLHEKMMQRTRVYRDLSPEENGARARRVMAWVDSLSPEWRTLLHEFGPSKVKTALKKRMTAKEFYYSQLAQSLSINL